MSKFGCLPTLLRDLTTPRAVMPEKSAKFQINFCQTASLKGLSLLPHAKVAQNPKEGLTRKSPIGRHFQGQFMRNIHRC